jgi:DNA-binding beta-propeller fold protein YncE
MKPLHPTTVAASRQSAANLWKLKNAAFCRKPPRLFGTLRGLAMAVALQLGMLAGLLAMATPLRADNPPTYLFQWGSPGSGNGQFSYPHGFAVDGSNDVYVADTFNYRVVKLTVGGSYLTQWGSPGSGNGQFDYPEGIAVDGSNDVYVADTYNFRIEKFSSSGTYLTQWGSQGNGNGQFEYPEGIAVDSSGNFIYVVDYINSRVEKFDRSGNYLAQWGSYGSGNGEFGNGNVEYPEGSIAVDSSGNFIYVIDYSNSRVEKFDSSGNYLAQWGSYGSGNGQFEQPYGIAVDSSNNVYVADSGNSRVEKFDSSGNYLTQWGGYGSGNGQFNSPIGIAVDSSGNFIYVADNDRIEVFVNNANIVPPIITQQPTTQAVAAGINATLSVSVIGTPPLAYQWISNNVAVPGATNATFLLTNVNISDSGTYSVLVTNNFGIELSGNAVLSVLPAADFLTPAYLFQIDSSAVPGAGFDPLFLALDSSNHLFVSDNNNDRVLKFTGNGTYLTQWGSYGGGNGQFNSPFGIAVDSSNNVYVADTDNNRVEKFDSSGNYLTQWGSYGTNNGQFEYPEGIAVDGSNNVYVADESNDRVEKFDSNGNYLTQWGSYGANNGQFESLYGMAVDSSNNIYVTDYYNKRVEKFDSNGNYLTQWGSHGANNGQFEYPEGIAVDSSNNVYVADNGNSRIEKFDSHGNYLTQWGSSGSGNGQFSFPDGIAVDRSGNFIYVADYDYNNSRIQVFVNNTNIVPPIITQQPTNQTVPAGFNVTFGVSVIGTAPFAFQWSLNNVAVPGATNATFTLTHVNLSASGNYSVLVTNSFGSELSGSAVLAIVPAFVTTQPASGLSATGAVLNGSVTVGPDETVAWFDWGTDTNYGSIAGATIVPGDNGSNSVSAALSGLPGNFYHYRMDAENDYGIVYGDDQSFTVGFAPNATTLPSTNGANGATLVAAVNPEGWDTTVYFRWFTPTLDNTTPGMDIGAGAASLNVSSFVPGLVASTRYQFQVVASNALGTTFGKVFYWDQLAPANIYLFSGSETNITLNPGTYIITAHGAQGGLGGNYDGFGGGGAEMSAEFNFSTSTTLTLLVGGGGGGGVDGYFGGGGGGGSFVVAGSTPLVIAGGGGGGGGGSYGDRGGRGAVSPNGVAGGFSGDAGGDGPGGTGGNGGGGGSARGQEYTSGGGGGGFLGDGTDGTGFGSLQGGGSGCGYGGYSYNKGGGGGYDGGGYGIASGGFGGGGGGGTGSYSSGGGGGGGYSGGGGAGDEDLNTYVGGGGGGGSIIDTSAIAILVPGPYSYAYSGGNGEIIITSITTPVAISTTNAAFGFTNGAFGFDVTGPSGSNVVIQASTDLQTWIPLQTNLLGSGPFYFSDPQSTTNVQRFYRAELSP